ncbi:MAG: hypothetical protein ACRENS_05455 [Candidatus Eiseniibacteriota bacterium]
MSPESTPRRDFLKLVGLAGLSTTLAAPARSFAQAAKSIAAPADSAKMKSAAADTTQSEENKPPSEDALALTMIVRRRYGQHLNADQLKSITEELDFRIQSGERLKAAKLTNGDEPDVVFHP